MKFIEIEIKNIASIGYARISFEEAPLCNEPLFLICGATGSGKSTILDAVCLALYGTAPRLDGYGNESFEDKGLNVAGGEESVKISNPCQLVRRNTGEAFARLTFIGNDGKRYTAMWHAMRGLKKRLDVKLKADSTLYCHDSDTTVNKRVAEAVASPNVTGLKFDEFCRTTLLAQGAFTRFLNSRSNEKSEILEKLTGTEIYSRISRQIFRTYSEKNNIYEDKKRTLDAYKFLTPEERDEKNGAIAAAEKELVALRSDLSAIETATHWLVAVAETETSIKREEQKLAEARSVASSDDTAEKQKMIADWNATAELRGNYARLNELKPKLKVIAETETYLHARYSNLCAQCAEIGRKVEACSATLQNLNKSLDIPSDVARMYENAAHLTAKMEEMLRIEREIAERSADIENNAKNLELTHGQLCEFEKSKIEAENILIGKRKSASEIAAKMEKEPSLDSILKLREQIDSLASILKDREAALSAIEKEQQKCARFVNEAKEAEKALAQCELKKGEAEQNYNLQSELYEKMHLRIDDHARALRAQLSVGDICPVCGERINTLLHDDEIMNLLLPLKEKLDEAKRLYDASIAAYNTALATMNTAKRLHEESNGQLSAAREEERKQAVLLEEVCAALSLSSVSAVELRNYIEITRQEIQQRQQERERLTKEYRRLSVEIENITAQVNDVNAKYGLAMSRYKQIESAIETLKTGKENSIKAFEELRMELMPQMTLSDWYGDIKSSIDELRNRSSAYKKAKEDAEALQQKIARTNELRERIALHRRRVEEAYPDFHPVEVHLEKADANVENVWTELSQDALLCKAERSKITEGIIACNNYIDAFHVANPMITRERAGYLCRMTQENVIAIQDEINSLFSIVKQYEALLSASKNRYAELSAQRPANAVEETQQTLAAKREVLEQRRSELEKQIGALIGELKQDDENLRQMNSLLKEVEELRKEMSRWKRLSDIFGSADGGKFKSIAQSYILLQLLENSNFYLRRFTSRYELTTQPGSLVILVSDREDGDTIRAANTLSGGESFMVSLALALGLSTLNRNNFTPDTLFIDEGFGTLSGDCLNTVIETLEVLHNIGSRRVGIISHVNELYERISTKIEVKKHAGISEVKITG